MKRRKIIIGIILTVVVVITFMVIMINNKNISIIQQKEEKEKLTTEDGFISTKEHLEQYELATKIDKSEAATADNISEGKKAWVNGKLIIGNGADNKIYITNNFSGQQLKLNQLTTAEVNWQGAGTRNSSYKITESIIDPAIFSKITVNACCYIAWNAAYTGTREGKITYQICKASNDEVLLETSSNAICSPSSKDINVNIDISEISELCYLKVNYYYKSGTGDCLNSYKIMNVYGTII